MTQVIHSTESGRSSNRRHLYSCSLDCSGHDRIVSLALILVILAITVGGSSVAFADEPMPQQMVTAYQDGKITGVYETTFQINHKSYSVTPDAVLLDRHGDPLSARYIQVDTEVKYHLEKGSQDRIDRMILFIPE
jgi:hypothetical protein